MAQSDVDTIDIRDESVDNEKRFQLYIDGCRRGLVTSDNKGARFHWQTAGPFQYEESRVWIQGLLELSMIALELDNEVKHVKKKGKRK